MNLNFLLFSFSVFYSKYNFCYEVPKNLPIRYFDGTLWKIMKPRDPIRLATNRPNISIHIDWPETSQECKKKETWPEFSQEYKKNETIKIQNKTTTIKKVFRATTKRVTTKKVIHKTTATATTKDCNSGCIIKKITLNIPRAMTSTTKKPSPRIIKRPPAKTTKKFVKTTKEPLARKPIAILGNKFMGMSTRSSIKEKQALPENWLKVIKDLVKTLKDVKNNNNQRGTECTAKLNPQYPLVDGRRAMDGAEDIMNLLLDGVEIDDSPDDANGSHSDYFSILPGFRGLPESQDTTLDLNEIEKMFESIKLNDTPIKDPKLNKNNVPSLDLKSIKDAIKSRYAKDGDQKSLQNREIKAYLDVLKSRYAKKDILLMNDSPLNLAAINAVVETKHPDNPEFREQAEYKDSFKHSDLKTYLDAKKSSGRSQNKAIKAYLDLLKSQQITRDTSQNDDALLDFDAVDPDTVIENSKHPGFREILESKNKENALELDLNSYLDAMNNWDETKHIKNYENTATRHPDYSELKEETVQDDFQGLDLSPFLHAIDDKYAVKSQDRSEDIYATIDNDTPDISSLNLDEIANLIASKHTKNTPKQRGHTTNTTKQRSHKKQLKNNDLKDFLNYLTRNDSKKRKTKLYNRDKTLEFNEEIEAINNIDEDKQNNVMAIDLERNRFATDYKSQQNITDTEEEPEDPFWAGPSFKYILDDDHGEQNDTREDNNGGDNNGFTWDDGGEIFISPQMRPTLAP